MESLICIAPRFDDVTEITYEESRVVVQYAKNHAVEVIDLVDKNAVQSKVEEALKQHPNALIYHADHGNESSWIGDDEKPCVSCETVKVLKGRECYCNNCSSAKQLGVEAWKLGATYWGYTDVFVFTTDAQEEFEEFINNGVKRKIDGLSWKQCLESTKELVTKLVDQLVKAGKALAASCMTWDSEHLVCYTEDMPPEESDCSFRSIGISLFGPKIAWKLGWKSVASFILYLVGFGVALHDACHHLYLIGGYREILSPQGIYIGFLLMVVGYLLGMWEHIKKLKN